MSRFFASLVLPLALSSVPASLATAQQYRIEQSTGGHSFGGNSTGQTFTPNIGITPDPGSTEFVALEEFTLYQGNFGGSNRPPETFLNIYDGDPAAGGSFVGSSLNSVDARLTRYQDPLRFVFAHTMLDYEREYWAILSSTRSSGALDVFMRSPKVTRGAIL